MAFGAATKKYLAEIRKDLDRKTRRIALATFQKINEFSPVVQGTFRANWNVSVDTIDRSFDPNLTSKDFEPRETIAAATIFTNAKLGTVIYITNSTPYAVRLENGYSWQRPEGVVAPTVEIIRRAIASGEFDK